MNTPNDMNKSNHTELPPTPWAISANWLHDANGKIIADLEGSEVDISALIVHRVNNWDKLVEALEFYAGWMTNIDEVRKDLGDKAKQALKLAKDGK